MAEDKEDITEEEQPLQAEFKIEFQEDQLHIEHGGNDKDEVKDKVVEKFKLKEVQDAPKEEKIELRVFKQGDYVIHIYVEEARNLLAENEYFEFLDF